MKIGLSIFKGHTTFKRAACGVFGAAAFVTIAGGCTFDNMLVKDSESMPRYNRPSFAPVVGTPDSSGHYTEVLGGFDKEPTPVVGLQFSH